MKILKVLTEFLKQVNAWDFNSNSWSISDGGDYAVLMRGTFMALRFPKDMFPFDLENQIVKDYYRNNIRFDEMTKSTDYIPAVFSGVCREVEPVQGKKKGIAKKIVALDNPERYAWVNEEFLKYFDEPTFAVSDTKGCSLNLVRIYEDNRLVGIVCPIRMKEETK